MINVLAKDRPEMTLRRDQHRIQALPPAAANPAVGCV